MPHKLCVNCNFRLFFILFFPESFYIDGAALRRVNILFFFSLLQHLMLNHLVQNYYHMISLQPFFYIILAFSGLEDLYLTIAFHFYFLLLFFNHLGNGCLFRSKLDIVVSAFYSFYHWFGYINV